MASTAATPASNPGITSTIPDGYEVPGMTPNRQAPRPGAPPATGNRAAPTGYHFNQQGRLVRNTGRRNSRSTAARRPVLRRRSGRRTTPP